MRCTLGYGKLSRGRIAARRTFSGQELMTASGHAARSRVFSASIGRWRSRDKLGYNDGASLYQYARSASVRYVDPYGLYTSSGGQSGSGSDSDTSSDGGSSSNLSWGPNVLNATVEDLAGALLDWGEGAFWDTVRSVAPPVIEMAIAGEASFSDVGIMRDSVQVARANTGNGHGVPMSVENRKFHCIAMCVGTTRLGPTKASKYGSRHEGRALREYDGQSSTERKDHQFDNHSNAMGVRCGQMVLSCGAADRESACVACCGGSILSTGCPFDPYSTTSSVQATSLLATGWRIQ